MGRRLRVDHDCGPGRTLLLSRGLDGLRAFCFRCNEHGSAPNPAESLAEKLSRLARLSESDGVMRALSNLPEPATYDLDAWPIASKLWLYKAGLGRAEIGRLGAYYHRPTDRVVLPVFEGGVAVFWQARATDNRAPKYLAPAIDRAKVLPRYGQGQRPTITEDILSAFKVGLVAEGWCAMGTRISAHMLNELMARDTAVNVWLDPDPAGQRGAIKIIKQLRAYGIETRNIISERDPKLHTRQEIREYLDA
jgi:hypothetical protein